MQRAIYLIQSFWDTIWIDVTNRFRRLAGGENQMTHNLPFKDRVGWRMYLYDSTRD